METIKLTSQYAIANKDEFIQKVREASKIKQSEDLKAYDKQLKRDKKRCSELDGVHAPDKSTGGRIQDVDIYLKFVGKLDIPIPEPTPEELAEQAKVRLKRQKQREANKRFREKQKRLQAKTQEQNEKAEQSA